MRSKFRSFTLSLGGRVMPYVRVMVSQTVLLDDADAMCVELAAALPQVVADALAVPESARFPATEVTIDTDIMDTPDPDAGIPGIDRMSDDVEILVLCDRYPERVERRHEIAKAILDGVDAILGKCSAWVYLRPDDAGFARRPRRE